MTLLSSGTGLAASGRDSAHSPGRTGTRGAQVDAETRGNR